MDSTDNFSHTGVSGSSPGDRMKTAGYGAQGWGENIAYVSGTLSEATVKQLHTNLMNSPGHYANIVRGSYEEIGISVHQGTMNGRPVVFATQNFGTPNSSERAEPNDVGGGGSTPTPPKPTEPVPPKPTEPVPPKPTEPKPPVDTDEVFDFNSYRQVYKSTIKTFDEGDAIDLRTLDADLFQRGNQAFKIVDKFTKGGNEIKFRQDAEKKMTYIDMNVDHDTHTDITLKVAGLHTFAKGDFIL
jgi:hypothetical protein